ncbi:MAG: hypothetical protein SCM96_08895 [Acidobacteriota bacterium]|nr:hypothetical protein [Acidobacteriota bacterium]
MDAYNKIFHGWQSLYHRRRFVWILNKLRPYDLSAMRIIELGCFDAKLLNVLPQKPGYYLGLDAGYENAVLAAARFHCGDDRIDIRLSTRPEDIPDERFDFGIAMETFEHIRPDLVEDYIARLAQVVGRELFVTIPVERGFQFLIATSVRLINRDLKKHTSAEFWNSLRGRPDLVVRDEHKGFDDRGFIRRLSRRFEIRSVESLLGPSWLGLNLGLAIAAVPRESASPVKATPGGRAK